MMAEEQKYYSGKNKIIGGVCSYLSDKLNVKPLIMRIIFTVLSLFFYFFVFQLFILPAFIYVIVWLFIPKKKLNSIERRKKYLSQTIGILVGSVLGLFIGYGFGLVLIGDDKSGFLVVLIFAVFGIPFGALIGFSISRMLFEKKQLK